MNLGNKIREIRTTIVKDSQSELSENLNLYIREHYSREEIENDNLLFFQSMISKIENDEIITSKKLLIILNYFHSKFKINPNWIVISDNNAIPFYINKVTIDSSLTELYNNIEIYSNEILKNVSDINIIIQNSTK